MPAVGVRTDSWSVRASNPLTGSSSSAATPAAVWVTVWETAGTRSSSSIPRGRRPWPRRGTMWFVTPMSLSSGHRAGIRHHHIRSGRDACLIRLAPDDHSQSLCVWFRHASIWSRVGQRQCDPSCASATVCSPPCHEKSPVPDHGTSPATMSKSKGAGSAASHQGRHVSPSSPGTSRRVPRSRSGPHWWNDCPSARHGHGRR